MSLTVLALVLGIVAGTRAFVATAAVSWAARLGVLHVSGTWASFMSSVWAVGIFSILTVVEFVTDQLPSTPSRTVPKQLIPRIISGGFSGAVIGATNGSVLLSTTAGVIGAVIGTFGSYEFRKRLVQANGGRDAPIAVLEDALAVVIAALALWAI